MSKLPQAKPIPHQQEGYPFVNPSATPKAKDKRMPTYKRYKHVESIAETDKLTIPECVVILGSGPNGRAAWLRIPKDAFVIALNEGVNISTDHPKECAFTPDVWIVNDPHVLDKPYWISANKNYEGIRIFGDSTIKLIRRRFLYVRAQRDAVREGRLFSIPRGPFHKHQSEGEWFHDPKIFKPGGTVAAAALWVAYIRGPAKRVYLCGIDMSMDTHYSNPEQPANPDPRHGVEWHTSRPALDERIRYYKTLGMEVFTMSETKLNLEMI